MNSLAIWFTKKRSLIVLGLTTIVFVVLYSGIFYTICKSNFNLGDCREIRQKLDFVTLLLLISPVILFFTFLTFKMKEEVFVYWKKFSFYYLLVYFIIVIATPWYLGDEFLHIEKDITALLMTVLYSLISIILILYKSFKKEV